MILKYDCSFLIVNVCSAITLILQIGYTWCKASSTMIYFVCKKWRYDMTICCLMILLYNNLIIMHISQLAELFIAIITSILITYYIYLPIHPVSYPISYWKNILQKKITLERLHPLLCIHILNSSALIFLNVLWICSDFFTYGNFQIVDWTKLMTINVAF